METPSSGQHPNSPAPSPLRIGLLVDSTVASHAVYEFAQWAQSHPNIIVSHLIVHGQLATGSNSIIASCLKALTTFVKRGGRYFTVSELALRIVESFEWQSVKRSKHHSRHFQTFDLSLLVRQQLSIAPIISEPGPMYRFARADIQKVKDLNLDLLVRCGFRNLTGAILNASRLGTISLDPGDDQTNRGGPAGFWEVYLHQDTTGFTIHRLADNVSADDVLMRGRFATRHFYLLNQAFSLRKSGYYLKRVVDAIATSGKLPDLLPKFPYSRKLLRTPGIHVLCIYVARRSSSFLMKRIRRVSNMGHRWNVAFVHGNWRDTELHRGITLERRSFQSLADPFVVNRNGKTYCFVEDLNHLINRGSIAVYELTESEGTFVGTALEEDFHLSFPYLFQFGDDLYMCPESSERKGIRIYKCIEFPLRWKLEKIVMSELSAADTMIFEREGKWWMITNIDPTGAGDYCSELYVFSSESPFESRWKPHPHNPVIVDASCARNAGFLVERGRYYRFSQSQGFDFYGKRLVINEITDLSEVTYRESRLSVITPSFGRGAAGIHHLHSDGKITVFDFAVRSRLSSSEVPNI